VDLDAVAAGLLPRLPGLRRLGPDDAAAVFGIAHACDLAEIGEADVELSDVTWELGHAASEWYGVEGPDGGLVAYAGAMKRPEHVTSVGEVRVVPGGDHALGSPLVELARRAAGHVDASVPLHLFVHASDDVRQQWLTAAGGHVVRHFWRMVLDLDGAPPPSPVLPADVDVRPVGGDRALTRATYDVVDAAFRDHFGHDPQRGMPFDEFVERTRGDDGFDDTLWWVAFVDGTPAAALIARRSDRGGYVDSLGTLRDFRARGLGRMLLQTAFVEFHHRGFRGATLGVDAANPTGAVRLYESVGMRADNEWRVYELAPLY